MRKASLKLMVALGVVIASSSFSVSCSAKQPKPQLEQYPTAFRQLPLQPVYSRLTWSHLPEPIRHKTPEETPLLLPIISFELPDSNLEKAVEALAQALGYRAEYPKQFATRAVSIKMVGTVHEILEKIEQQAQVTGSFDHERRIVIVIDNSSGTKRSRSQLQPRLYEY